MENIVGRILSPDEVVHHKDGDKLNNRPENLELLSHSSHAKKHNKGRLSALVELRCPSCGSRFVKCRNQTHLVKKSSLGLTFCSSRCRGIYSRKLQLGRLTESDIEAASKNVVSVFNGKI